MARFTVYQNKNRMSRAYGKWYARVQTQGVKTTKDMALAIQQNASVKKSDVKAVLDELVEVMEDWLAAGYRLKLDGIGSFKATLTSKGELTPEEVTARSIKTKVQFQPEVSIDSTGHRHKALIGKVTWEEAAAYDKPVTPEPEP